MHKKIWVLLYFITLVSTGLIQANAQKAAVSKWPRGITYEIYIQSFADSNGDGKGDINGMTAKLDYLQDLGVEAVWLMPIHPSRSYHKYDVSDYYAIDPDYGTMDDFKRFVAEAHKRNIKVVIDMVVNHSGREHAWFQEALKDSNSKYWNYYVWTHKDDPQTEDAGNITAGESRRFNKWRKVDSSDHLFYAQFSTNMPDLNFDNPKLREEIFKIGKFWASEVKVDGFRLDAARHIFPDERPHDNHQWWLYFQKEMKKVNPDFYLIGEVWASTDIVGPYLKGIPALFNFDMAGAILKAVNNGKGDSLAIRHKAIRDFYRSVNPDYIDATFLSNHDQNRVMSVLNNDQEKARIAAAILMTLPGSPYLYYGEEIGMQGKKPDPQIREPFLWDIKSKDKERATWEVSKFSTDTTVIALATQKKDPLSLYNFYRSLIHVRNTSKALTYGEIEPVQTGNSSLSAFIRSYEPESLLIVHNVSNLAVVVDLPAAYRNFSDVFYKNKNATLTNMKLRMDPYSTIILKLANGRPAPVGNTSDPGFIAGIKYENREDILNAPDCNPSEAYIKKKIKAQLARDQFKDYPHIAVDFTSFKGQHGYDDKKYPNQVVYPFKIEMLVYVKRKVMQDGKEYTEVKTWEFDRVYEYATRPERKCELYAVPAADSKLVSSELFLVR